MNFNAPLLRPFRILLFPFSLVYGAAIWLRNRLYDKKILRSTGFNLPLICIGNLSVGGTGKSPMVEWIVKYLHTNMEVAILSRGYKRRTKGYALAGENSTALDIGDEPMQFHQKFPDVTVAVGEERIVAIPQLLHDRPNTKVVILDDAFQHRAIKAGLNIVLTNYDNLFTRDWMLPTGDLRDERRSYKRADVIVVTKCPAVLSVEEKERIKQEIKLLPHQQLFFTTIRYGSPYHIISKKRVSLDTATEVLLVSGIANPMPLKKYLQDATKTYYEILYGDHHIFRIDDWKEIVKRFNNIPTENKIILTTEKDAVRLIKFGQTLQDYPIYVIPIEIQFLFNEGHQFTDIISKFITDFSITN
ncbi:tetraacyldisaccharide 4'-kinase [Niastella yeongjuensis]|uniref:Tetraacyldisaccharide 4'-kinase n=1 Tax=Niastella yeongjuensis TaxID=354355 RepID=A0A1V9F8R8_9BACT|nr:tetraacyldisaccharide 4'-kinase [Niastella yeongjuensis]OQP54616.1 tetraacyldisaccharide 4'-kinase [Niastella yeongjuensis]SEO01000.1 lipid-A-disaccharide kinase [Niastella yeongjuensis]